MPSKADDIGGGYSEAISLGYSNVLFPFGWVAVGLIVAVVVLMGEFAGKTLNGTCSDMLTFCVSNRSTA